jgi:tetratricopeptide (TPR) repeat protein
LELRKKVYGPSHPNVALTLADLGEFRLTTKHYDAAIEIFEQALRMVEETLGPENIYTSCILFQYAEARRLQGRHEEALAAYDRTIRILTASYGPDHPRLAYIYRRAAISAAKLKRKNETKFYEQRASAIDKERIDWREHTIDVSAFLPGK